MTSETVRWSPPALRQQGAPAARCTYSFVCAHLEKRQANDGLLARPWNALSKIRAASAASCVEHAPKILGCRPTSPLSNLQKKVRWRDGYGGSMTVNEHTYPPGSPSGSEFGRKSYSRLYSTARRSRRPKESRGGTKACKSALK